MFTVQTTYRNLLADTFTPINIYLKLRDVFPNSLLLESADYRGMENSMSYICCQPVAGLQVHEGKSLVTYPDGRTETAATARGATVQLIRDFIQQFKTPAFDGYGFISGGLFGYMTYDSVRYFEDITLSHPIQEERSVPEINYNLYTFVIAINHFKDEMHIFHHEYVLQNSGDLDDGSQGGAAIDALLAMIRNKNIPSYPFARTGHEHSNFEEKEFLDQLAQCKAHVLRGDVFQMQLSRRFWQRYRGDEFNVYRALRSINPSPYLFYFDYGNFKILGSSPETQILIKNDRASIHPIAGTFKRSGRDEEDAALGEKLKADPKENAEHVMLVDLARNDLARHCNHVAVANYKELQFYSHVVHLVSKVTGMLKPDAAAMRVVADTFPAGTLTGAPKFRAMQLIDQYEPDHRGIYGGAIGHMDLNGDFNHAIMIRTFLSKNNTLFYQAAAGVVADSVLTSEREEVNNKLSALRRAIDEAENL